MNNTNSKNSKKNYEIPAVQKIIIDNEITLQLESNPPLGPDETNNVQLNQTNPFKNEMV